MSVSWFQRVIHGWLWNTFAVGHPILPGPLPCPNSYVLTLFQVGMSCSAVCLALASLDGPGFIKDIAFVFFVLNITLFVFNTTSELPRLLFTELLSDPYGVVLALQAMTFPARASQCDCALMKNSVI